MVPSQLFRIKVITPWPSNDFQIAGALFSSQLSLQDADALLCSYSIDPAIFTFRGPKAWYCCEPAQNKNMGFHGRKQYRDIISQLAPHEKLYHSHPDPQYRVPHITHRGAPPVINTDRKKGAIGVISNFGGSPANRWPAIKERNKFATTHLVDLYGSKWIWQNFRPTNLSISRLPRNYKGELDGSWGQAEKIDLLAQYSVCVCLENSQEDYYFTEKYVDAVIAGCIPVYRAHPTVKESFLQGAFWVDPADYDSPEETIQAALQLDRKPIAEQNATWLKSIAAKQTNSFFVNAKIASILKQQR